MVMTGILVAGSGVMMSLPFTVMTWPKWVLLFGHSKYRVFYEQSSPLISPLSREASIGFWRGESTVPWDEWIGPIVTWTVFMCVLFFVMFCLVIICRRHWVEHERLQFPLVQPVLEVTTGCESGFGPFWSNRLVWLGVLIPTILGLFNGLHEYFPAVPQIRFEFIFRDYVPSGSSLWWALNSYPYVRFSLYDPAVIGIGYLIPTALNFSIWFFFMVYRFVILPIAFSVGATDPLTAARAHGGGARIGLALLLLWRSRHVILRTVRRAFGMEARSAEPIDRDEPISYSTAVFGWIIGTAVIVVFSKLFLWADVWMALFWVLLVSLSALVLARIRAESGVPIASGTGDDLLPPLYRYLDGKVIGAHNGAYAGYLHTPFTYSNFGGLAPIVMEQLVMADETGTRRKSMMSAIFVALVAGVLFSWIFGLPLIYRLGGSLVELAEWRTQSALTHYEWVEGDMGASSNVPLGLFLFFGIGSGVTIFLGRMYETFLWWPFNPTGYLLATTLVTNYWIWSHFFVAWVIKTLVLRYGGGSLYKKLTPLFVAFIVGSVINNAFWAIVGLIAR